MTNGQTDQDNEWRDYSLAAFERASSNPEDLAALCRRLRDDVTERLEPTLIGLMEEIVSKLNAEGHDLRLYVEPADGEIAYRDRGTAAQPVARLRLAHDSIVSVGFGDFDPT